MNSESSKPTNVGSNDQLGLVPKRDIVDRLYAGCTDWDGSQMADETPPMDCLTAGDAREAATAIVVLRNHLDTALGMLADWCVAVDVNGTGWDDWDEHYKDAAYRDGPLRAMLDKSIAEARERRA